MHTLISFCHSHRRGCGARARRACGRPWASARPGCCETPRTEAPRLGALGDSQTAKLCEVARWAEDLHGKSPESLGHVVLRVVYA